MDKEKRSSDYSMMLEKIRCEQSIEECDERGCSYSDHYPQCQTPVMHHQVLKNHWEGDSNVMAGPSGNNAAKHVNVKLEQWYSSPDTSNSD